MGDVLQVSNVVVRRGGRHIIDGIDWSVNEGERWVVLGPNGAGKTTLIRLISGRMHPTSGKVTIIGEQLGHTDVSELYPLVGLASSALDQRINDAETVLNVVRSAAYGMVGTWRESYEELDDERALGLLDALGVAGLADQRWGTLSSGERKRVGIARALMPDPEVLVLDEPASGLDLGGREQLLTSLSQLAGGIYAPVIVLVTHHVEDIPQGFTHGLLLKDGQVAAAGELEEVMTSKTLSSVFGVDVDLSLDAGRYTARAWQS
ncbi:MULTISPECIES: ABC transporter ATP-binding protein [Trueperella]|uniref:ABC transporter ATP-binding protein n=1 Tax=Trueperella TaxID=1069494 RepID=UPI0008A1AE37|nr:MULTISPECIES: ABC transporter ATP-binding protein [Trueperella]MCM3906679.1 ABC transporter ATP-binding protein [Trueperella bernardiae]OFS76116.1 ABC transporter ATP-binding protein [Trueperella sp. HMSC08B05]